MLLYHSPTGKRGASPFDSTILDVVQGNAIKIISPYIGLSYLERIIKTSSSWRLISDVEAWMSALNHKERVRTGEFIHKNIGNVRHLSGVHAKTVIGPKMAYMGSANLTNIGILSRTELGIRITEDAAIEELHVWFDALWHVTTEITSEQIHEIIDRIGSGPERDPPGQNSTRPKPVLQNRATFAQFNSVPEPIPRLSQSSSMDIDAALQAAFDTISEDGFTLDQLRVYLSPHFSLALKTLYLRLIRHCAAIPRTVFSRESVNRLVYVGGVFVQSTPLRLTQALQPFDNYLAAIIRSLSFETPRQLPAPDQLERLTGIPKGPQASLVRSLIQEQMLLGDQGAFVLNDTWEWSPKFKLFTKSLTAWQDAERSQRISLRSDGLPKVALTLPSSTSSSLNGEERVAVISTAGPILTPLGALESLPALAEEVDLALREALQDPANLASRIDHIYASLFEMIKTPPVSTKLPDFDALVRYVVRLSGDELWLVSKVLKGEVPGFPKLLKFKFKTGRTPCRIYFCDVPMDLRVYPRTNALLKLRTETNTVEKNRDTNVYSSTEITADDVFLALLQLISEFGETLPYTHLTGLYRHLAKSLDTQPSVITSCFREHEGTAPITIDRLTRNQRPSNQLIATVYELTEEQTRSLPKVAKFLATMRASVLPRSQLT